MQSTGGHQAVGFLIAGAISVPLLFFGWWTVCFVDIAVAVVLFFIPRRFGANVLSTVVFAAILLTIMGLVIGIYERKGLVDPGPTGLEEALLGALDGLYLVTLPAVIVFGLVCIVNLLPARNESTVAEIEEEDQSTSGEGEEDDALVVPPNTTEPTLPGRKCANCGTLAIGNEERCWYCGKRV
jgi:hypothetical protein